MLDAVVDHGTDNMMCFTEGHAFASQVISQVRGVGVTQIGVVAHFFSVNRHLGNHRGHDTKAG